MRGGLLDFIHDVSGAFGKPEMPFVIASTGMATSVVESSPYPNYTEVEQAQLWVAGDAPPVNVRSSDTRSFMETATESPRDQAFHWNGNARSYFRIGRLLGDDMIMLLGERLGDNGVPKLISQYIPARAQSMPISPKTTAPHAIHLIYMKNKYTCFIAGILAIAAAHGQSLLLGGFDGTNALNAPKQSAGLAGLTVALTTDAPETNSAGQMMSTLWGAADLDPDAFTLGTIADLAVVRGTSTLTGWTFTLTITNNTGSDVNLEKIHYRTKKDANDGPDLQVVSYTSGSLADATGKNTGPFAIGIGSNNPCDVDLSGFLTDLTLAGNGETAVFTWSYGPPANPDGNTGLRIDNIAISGSTGSSGSKSAAPTPKPKTYSAGAQSKTWDNDPNGIKVFILAGQSNMVGYGKTEDGGNPDWVEGSDVPKEIKGGLGCLRYLAMHDDKYPEFAYRSLLADPGKPETSAWKTRRDVKVWWRNGHSGKLGGEIRKGDLGPPFQGGNGSWFGPEYAFGQIIGDHYKNDDVLIIKTAWGGHSLVKDFRSPTAVEKRGGEVGESYKEIFRQSRECLDKLGEEFPEWKGGGYQIVGFAWHQGFSDRVKREHSAEYKDNLSDFIADVRKEFGNPGLPFVIASTGMATGGGVEEAPYKGYSEVERAQLWAAGDARPANVLSTDTRPFWRPDGESPSTAGYHWNHSAYSYFMVGKALGDDMVELLSP